VSEPVADSVSLYDPSEQIKRGGPILAAHSYYPSIAENESVPAYERGRAIYNYRCYFCHAYSGDAVTQASTFLDPKPRNFRTSDPLKLTKEKMLEVVSLGKPDTAMKSFDAWLTPEEIELVVEFIRQEFMLNKRENTRYHTAANGWADHERYAIAFPFATGEIPTDTLEENLTEQQRAGLKLFMESCVACHDRGKVENEGEAWVPKAVSYPRNGYSHRSIRPDAVSEASVFGRHDIKPQIDDLSEQEAQGEKLFQDSCAFCHGMAGTGKNWIGSFLEPLPRDLTDPEQMAGMTSSRLTKAIEDGVINTKMPAWKSVLTPEQIAALVAYIDRAFYPLEEE